MTFDDLRMLAAAMTMAALFLSVVLLLLFWHSLPRTKLSAKSGGADPGPAGGPAAEQAEETVLLAEMTKNEAQNEGIDEERGE